MEEINKLSELNSIDSAIYACGEHIKRHKRDSSNVLMLAAALIFGILVFAGVYAVTEGGVRDQDRLRNLNDVEKSNVEFGRIQSQLVNTNKLFNDATEAVGALKAAQPPNSATENELKEWRLGFSSADVKRDALKELKLDLQKQSEAAQNSLNSSLKIIRAYTPKPLITQELMIGIVALLVIIISVFTTLYRFHQKEISKNEQYQVAFLRIRIAANNIEKEGFRSEVRIALTTNAFAIVSDGLFDKKEKKVESPLPGHPTSELATGLLNKLLDGVEIVMKPKDK